MALKCRLVMLASAVAAMVCVVQAQRAAGDWTQWRGPNRDGIVSGFSEPAAWPEKLTQKWKAEVGPGYATPLLVGDKLYVFSRQGEQETMSELEAASGKVLWKTGYPATFTMHSAAARHGAGPKST